MCENGKPPQYYFGAEFMTLHGDAAVTITDYYDDPDMTRPSNLARMTSREIHKHKYAKSGLSSDSLLEYKSRLEEIMHSQEAYLRSDLTVPKLAESVNCSVNHLSQVINSGFGVSFFDYLNQFRIQHAYESLLYLLSKLVNDAVPPNLNPLFFCHGIDSRIYSYMKAHNNCIRG